MDNKNEIKNAPAIGRPRGLLFAPAILRLSQSRRGLARLFELEYQTSEAAFKKQRLQVALCVSSIQRLRHVGAAHDRAEKARSLARIKVYGRLSLQRAQRPLTRLPSRYKDAASPSRSQTSRFRANAGSR